MAKHPSAHKISLSILSTLAVLQLLTIIYYSFGQLILLIEYPKVLQVVFSSKNSVQDSLFKELTFVLTSLIQIAILFFSRKSFSKKTIWLFFGCVLINCYLFLYFLLSAVIGSSTYSELSLLKTINYSQVQNYSDTKTGISYQYPSDSWLKVHLTGWSLLGFSGVKPSSILSDDHQLYGLEFGKPRSEKDIEYFFNRSDLVHKKIIINGTPYTLFKRADNSTDEFVESRYFYFIPDNHQYVIAVLTPTDFSDRFSINQLFLKVIESIKPL